MDTRRYSINDYMSAQFFQLPKWLFKGKYEKMLTNNERILYAILRERFSISIANEWTDEAGNIFFYYKQEELAECSCLCIRTVQRSIKNLKAAGLLDEERSGANIPNRLYLLKPECEELTDKECMQNNIPSENKAETENVTLIERCPKNHNSAETEGKKRTCQIVVSVENASENGYDKMSYPSAGAPNCENGHDIMSPRTRQIVMPDTTDCRPNNTELINKKELINNYNQYHNHTTEHDYECDNDNTYKFAGNNTQKFNRILSELKEKVGYEMFSGEKWLLEKIIADEILSAVVSVVYLLPGDREYNVMINRGVTVKIKNDTVKSIFNKHLNRFTFLSYIRQFISKSKRVSNPTAYHIAGLYRQCLGFNSKLISEGRMEEV